MDTTPTAPKLIITNRNDGQSTAHPNWSFTTSSTSWPPTNDRMAADANMMYPARNFMQLYLYSSAMPNVSSAIAPMMTSAFTSDSPTCDDVDDEFESESP